MQNAVEVAAAWPVNQRGMAFCGGNAVDLSATDSDAVRTCLEQVTIERNQAVTALRRAESELQRVSTALLGAQEAERKRIAHELHDSIGQTMGNVRFGISVALNLCRAGNIKGAEAMLLDLKTQAGQAIGEVRRIAMDLRPSTLDDLGIVGTLSWFFRQFRAVHPELEVAVEVAVQEGDVSGPMATAIYRVMQEACSNVARHSGATQVRSSLRQDAAAIILCVADNGRGIGIDGSMPGGRTNPGMGMRSMRDRVESTGGTFSVESVAGAGTCIRARWPRADCPAMPT